MAYSATDQIGLESSRWMTQNLTKYNVRQPSKWQNHVLLLAEEQQENFVSQLRHALSRCMLADVKTDCTQRLAFKLIQTIIQQGSMQINIIYMPKDSTYMLYLVK